jgi:Zn-dependent protease
LFGGYCALKDEIKISKAKDAFTNMTYTDKLLIAFAGCYVNIVMGLVIMTLAKLTHNFHLDFLGMISVVLGITNLIPFPCLDGSYPLLALLEKIYDKKKGYMLMDKICRYGFIILMTLNVLSIPFIFPAIRMMKTLW